MIEIVRAVTSDAAELTEIAHAAKRHWGYPERWIEAWSDVLTITPKFIAQDETYVARSDASVSGFYAFIWQEGNLRLEHCWVVPRKMRRGIGRALFSHAVMRASELGYRSFEIEADPNAEGFYLAMGARRISQVVTTTLGVERVLPLLIYELLPDRDP